MHPNSSYATTKLYEMFTSESNNNNDLSEKDIVTFPTVDVCSERLAAGSPWRCMQKWQDGDTVHPLFFAFKISLLPKARHTPCDFRRHDDRRL